MKSFATAFNQADVLVVTEVYPAGETPIPGVTGKALYEEIGQFGHKNVHYEPNMKKVPALIKRLARPGDIVRPRAREYPPGMRDHRRLEEKLTMATLNPQSSSVLRFRRAFVGRG
jgi:hypothetical protein